jgi:WD40 repeat protein
MEDNHHIATLTGYTSGVLSVVWSPDGTRLASCSKDGTIRLWDPATGRQVGEPLTGHTGWVRLVVWSPDGTRLASWSNDGTIRLWDPATGRQVGEPLTGHTDWVRAVVWSPDGTQLASCSDDKTIRLWTNPTHLRRVEAHRVMDQRRYVRVIDLIGYICKYVM